MMWRPPAWLCAPLVLAATVVGRSLPPGNLIVGYAPHCNATQILQSAGDGVNVIIWFSVNLAANSTIQNELNFTCIAGVAHDLRARGLVTSHLISVGGWDAPHPDTSLTGEEWFSVWSKWNADTAAAVPSHLKWSGFDGIDWDLEGNDEMSSPWNHFTVPCMELVGGMSQAAKASGYIVSLVPPQSYWDVTSGDFDLSLTHSYPEFHPEFHYRGRNAYAVLFAKYGNTALREDTGSVPTFDIVMVQLYESWSRACEAINGQGIPAPDYLVSFVHQSLANWTVDFSSVPSFGLGRSTLQLRPEQLVIGFSRGIRDGSGKSVFVWPEDVGTAWKRLESTARDALGAKEAEGEGEGVGEGEGDGEAIVAKAKAKAQGATTTPAASGRVPRGVMFWNILNDNTEVNGTNATSSFARGFNEFLHTR